MKSVLITGGAGFIGMNLIEVLSNNEYSITVLDNCSVGSRTNLESYDVRFIEGDVRDQVKVVEAITECNMVVHLAAHTNVINSISDPLFDADINVLGTLNILNAIRKKNCPSRFVLASSGAPIGNQPPPANEKVAPRPVSPYGASKLAGEGYCSAFYGSYGIETVALRFSNAYGPKSAHKTSVVAKFIREILDGNDIVIFGDGSQTRDFIFVKDICNAIRLALETPDIGGELFQIATGTEVSVHDLAKKLISISGKDTKIVLEDFRQGEIKRNFSDISHARQVLGYEPEYDLDDGLKITYDWFTR